MSTEQPSPQEPDPRLGEERPDISEEELRSRLEDELRKITVRDVLLQTVVSLVNLAGQRLGLVENTEDMKDLPQVRTAIEAVRVLLPLLEEESPEQVRPIRDALAQLQMAYAREVGESGEPPPPGPAPPRGSKYSGPGGPGQNPTGPGGQPSKRGAGGLWVPPGTK
jgi:hypothetical protein